MENECIKCKKNPIYIKKWGLCSKCYHQMQYQQHKQNIYYGSEVEFVKNFFNHKNWIYQPAIFKINEDSYKPDFYDGERNVFIEVAGSRQAFSSNQEKYRQFIKVFPCINFEVRYDTGEIISLNDIKAGKAVFHVPEKRFQINT